MIAISIVIAVTMILIYFGLSDFVDTIRKVTTFFREFQT